MINACKFYNTFLFILFYNTLPNLLLRLQNYSTIHFYTSIYSAIHLFYATFGWVNILLSPMINGASFSHTGIARFVRWAARTKGSPIVRGKLWRLHFPHINHNEFILKWKIIHHSYEQCCIIIQLGLEILSEERVSISHKSTIMSLF